MTFELQSHMLRRLSPTSALNLAAYVVVLGIIYIAYKAIYAVYFHPLSSFPGPTSWAVSQIQYVRHSVAGNIIRTQLELHRRYGKVVRIGPNELSYCEAAVWRDVWAYRKGHEEFSKTSLQIVVPPNGTYGILGASRMDHRRVRKLLSHSFSEKAMREQHPTIKKHVDLLVDRLRERAGKEPQNIVEWFNWTTFDVIGALAFDQSFNCLEHGQTHPWIKAIFGSVKAGVFFSAMKRLGLDWLAHHLVSKEAVQLRNDNFAYSQDKIKERLERADRCGDFWDNVLQHSHEEGGMTMREMTSTAANIVLGGSETTATLLSGCVYLLLTHPKVMSKVVAEIREAFPTSDDIDLFTVTDLKYTLAVLDETMRIYPPVPEHALRVVPPGGDTVHGQYLPEGTMIHFPQLAANRLESNFTRPEEFIPERFLGDEAFADDNYDVLQPFSVGPRNCIGKNLAYAEMRLILAKMLWNFDFALVKGQDDWMDQKTFTLWEKPPLMVNVKKRGGT
ncbi:cytochrome protein [Pseudomassariella vexata]|uniref:Cytochrome protein n=1 Tax=Pseudomassariella vexata TaxID=1141098 RepID=A0A1Y2EIR3_9PEZI|nr:cytochrome protein [Pseudomassariella vexata]ORY71471.1 cytochrome protein [Pseudomassariella vexata]